MSQYRTGLLDVVNGSNIVISASYGPFGQGAAIVDGSVIWSAITVTDTPGTLDVGLYGIMHFPGTIPGTSSGTGGVTRGAWSGNTSYNINDIVLGKDGVTLYRCIQAGLSSQAAPTKFLTNIDIGDIISVVSSNVWFNILAVLDDERLQIDQYSPLDTVYGAAYVITRDFTTNVGLPLIQPGDIETGSLINRVTQTIDKIVSGQFSYSYSLLAPDGLGNLEYSVNGSPVAVLGPNGSILRQVPDAPTLRSVTKLFTGALVLVANIGIMLWNPTSIAMDDGSTVIKPTSVSGAGRWVSSGQAGVTAGSIVAALGYTPANAATVGAANGLATLDASGKLTAAQIPGSLLGALAYQGTWNASTNTPTLTNTPPASGQFYIVSTAGTTTLSGISSWGSHDWIVSNGTSWQKIDNSTALVISVAGRTGNVVLTVTDIAGAASAASPVFTGTMDLSSGAFISATGYSDTSTYSTAATGPFVHSPAITSTATAVNTVIGLVSSPVFTPTVTNAATLIGTQTNIRLGSTALLVPKAIALSTQLNLSGAGYAGTLASGVNIEIDAPVISGSQPITNYTGILFGTGTTNGQGTTGTVTNTGIALTLATASAGLGGSVTNTGLLISGNGGANVNITTNYAIWSQSTAQSVFAGPMFLNAGATVTGTLTRPDGAIVSSTGLLQTSAITGTAFDYSPQLSTSTTAVPAFQVAPTLVPTLPFSDAYGALVKTTMGTSTFGVTRMAALAIQANIAAGFTGLVSDVEGIRMLAPSLGALGKASQYSGIVVAAATLGNGAGSGNYNNVGVNVAGSTAGAAAGGNVGNYGMIITLATGTGAGTTANIGLAISGNGGTAASGVSNYAIYSTSTAPSALFGSLGIGMVPVNALDITQNQNSPSLIKILNNNAGTVAFAQVQVSNGTHLCAMTQFGEGFTSGGVNRAGGAKLSSIGTGGLTVGTSTATPLYFCVNDAQVGMFDASGNFNVGPGFASYHYIAKTLTSNAGNLLFQVASYGIAPIINAYSTSAFSPNAANAALKVGHDNITNRAITTGGSIAGAGADYAEYRKLIAALYGLVAKGALLGYDANGLMTNVFADVVGRVIPKSTNPSVVGGDIWGTEASICAEYGVAAPGSDRLTNGSTDTGYPARLAAFNAALETERVKWDRIALCGVVPINVTGLSTADIGKYLVPCAAPDGTIAATVVAKADLTLGQYIDSFGTIEKIGDDGRPLVNVKNG